jgi:hypothetical protein
MFHWESLEPNNLLASVNVAAIVTNTVLIVLETRRSRTLCCMWTVGWGLCIAWNLSALQIKNPVTISAMGFALRLVMLRVMQFV